MDEGGNIGEVNVGTHEKRYEFCQDNADNIYCEVDPEGDAFTEPPNCEENPNTCTVEDCQDAYEESDLYDTCSTGIEVSIFWGSSGGSYGARCKIGARCGVYLSGGDFFSGFTNMWWPLDDVDDLVFCPDNDRNTIQVGSC